MVSLRAIIKKRLEKYLELDSDGIRSVLMKIFLRVKEVTIDDIYKELSKKFEVTRNAVASMVGYIHSKLGVLRKNKTSYKETSTYSIKEKYVDIVKTALNNANVS